jgi:hypothetical protein
LVKIPRRIRWRLTSLLIVMKDEGVKRLQISIEDDLDEALERRSAQEGVSKAALIRRFVRMELEPLPTLEEDPLRSFIGAGDFEPAQVDDVVYE